MRICLHTSKFKDPPQNQSHPFPHKRKLIYKNISMDPFSLSH
uniref:Uncharacterized protein n=1 Tax=Rhizophora mucronata TaxID=61149 RepID=A0A2P2Q3F6_RHIMU